MSDDSGRRHSKPAEPEIEGDPQRQAEREALNALRQFDRALDVIKTHVEDGRPFRLRPSLILGLHREALDGLSAYAGNFRPGGVSIEKSKHTPPDAHLVPELIEDMCDYVNENWGDATALHLASYVMWRLNWIHPFADGNGRTSRIISYVVLCVAMNSVLPGTNTIPDQITANRSPYFAALDAADAAYRDERIDVSQMESLMEDLLAGQLLSAIQDAGGH